jgi:phospholipase/lecithinase/hemolysin
VGAGANNLIDIVETKVANFSSYDPTADLTKAISDIGTIVGGLTLNAAKNILVPNLPDFGRLPLVTDIGPQAPPIVRAGISFTAPFMADCCRESALQLSLDAASHLSFMRLK